jgi:hypothetical protein
MANHFFDAGSVRKVSMLKALQPEKQTELLCLDIALSDTVTVSATINGSPKIIEVTGWDISELGGNY